MEKLNELLEYRSVCEVDHRSWGSIMWSTSDCEPVNGVAMVGIEPKKARALRPYFEEKEFYVAGFHLANSVPQGMTFIVSYCIGFMIILGLSRTPMVGLPSVIVAGMVIFLINFLILRLRPAALAECDLVTLIPLDDPHMFNLLSTEARAREDENPALEAIGPLVRRALMEQDMSEPMNDLAVAMDKVGEQARHIRNSSVVAETLSMMKSLADDLPETLDGLAEMLAWLEEVERELCQLRAAQARLDGATELPYLDEDGQVRTSSEVNRVRESTRGLLESIQMERSAVNAVAGEIETGQEREGHNHG